MVVADVAKCFCERIPMGWSPSERGEEQRTQMPTKRIVCHYLDSLWVSEQCINSSIWRQSIGSVLTEGQPLRLASLLSSGHA